MVGVGNKRGWMRILEATIAVMMISTVLIVVYSRQDSSSDVPSDYVYDLQKEVLMHIYANSSLRLNTLNTVVSGDADFMILDDYVEGQIPDFLNYSIKVCNITESITPCKLNEDDYIATLHKPVFVEEIIVSAELGQGTNAVYKPKRLRLFVWEK